MKLLDTVFDLVVEQDLWTRKAASGPQKCGRDAKWCSDGDNNGGKDRVRPEKVMNDRQLRKYNESLYNEFLTPPGTPDFQQRYSSLLQSSDLKSNSGDVKDFALIYNLTNRIAKSKDWFFGNTVRKTLNLPANTPITDKVMYEMIKSKGGFDSFRTYYLTNIM